MTRLLRRAPAPFALVLFLCAILALPVPAVLAAGKPPPQPQTPPTPVVTGSVAAIINGHRVPISTYRLLLTLQHRTNPSVSLAAIDKNVRQDIVYDELIREYADAHGIRVTAAELAAQEKQDITSSRLTSQKQFEQLLKQRYGLTLAQYQQIITPNVLAQKVEQRVAPIKGVLTDAQARALAERLLNQLHHGANFATLARKYSGDPGSAAQGGDLGEIRPGETVPPFDHAVFHGPLKTYILVHSTFGYHIVEVLSRRQVTPPGQPKSVKVFEAHVRHILISTQASSAQQTVQRQKFLAWLQTQQKHAHITWVAKVRGG